MKTYNPGTWSGKPYNNFSDYLSGKYGTKVLKLPIDAGMSCPNRDGTLGTSGCIFCDSHGSASPTVAHFTEIREQMQNARQTFKRANEHTRYIAYFQAFTNTYAPGSHLKEVYDIAISSPDIVGLMVATRPDCISDQVMELLTDYIRPGFELWLEIGMQTMHERSLKYLNRGHTHEATRDTIHRAHEKKIPVCVHIILGIPDETWHEMMETACEISSLPVQGVKIHHLHVIKDTPLENIYEKNAMNPLSFREYISILCDFIERLRPDILIHRLSGDRNEETLIAPRWGMHKGTVIKAIDDEFIKRGTFQGLLYNSNNGQ